MPYKPRLVGTIAVTAPKCRNPEIAAQSLFVFFVLAVRHVLLPLPPPMAPKREKRAVSKVKQSAQKKPSGASLIRRQPPPRAEKAQKRSERTAAMADMRRRQALFPSIYAGATEKLQAA